MSTLVAKTIKPTSGDTVTFSDCNVSIGGTLTYDDVTNVDSVGLITARSGIEVSGIVTAPTYYGSGANLSGLESGVVNFVASGTIDNGKTVIINTDGTVGIVTMVPTSNPSFGDPVVFDDHGRHMGSAYDTDNNKVIIVYSDPDSPYTYAGSAVVGTVSGDTITFGTPVVFGGEVVGRMEYTSVAYIGSSRIVVGFQDYNNSYYGTAIVGNVSGNTIGFGTATVFQSSSTNWNLVSSIGSDKVVIAYNDWGQSGYGKAIVGTVGAGNSSAFPNDGRTWSAASSTNLLRKWAGFSYNLGWYAETTAVDDIGSIAFDPPIPISSITSFKVNAQSNGTNSQNWGFNGGSLTARVCNGVTDMTDLLPGSGNLTSFELQKTGAGVAIFNEILIDDVRLVDGANGPSLTYGSAATFESGQSNGLSSVPIGSNKVVISYYDAGDNDKGKAVVGTVSGTSITFGTLAEYESNSSSQSAITYDSTNDKVIVAYRDVGNSNQGTAKVGTVTGTGITFGAASVYNSGASTLYNALSYSSTSDKVVVAYRNDGSSGAGTAKIGTISGTDITWGSALVYDTDEANYNSSVYDPDNDKIVISYEDDGNSNKGTSVVFGFTSQATNLTTENYIGIAGEAIANGATGKVNVVGGVNSGQSGLTTAKTYYVGQTGILTTTADTPSVVAGTSISSTKIKVR